MNRREMLLGAGMAAAAVLPGSSAQESPPQPGRKLKVVITGGHPGDPEYACGGMVARLTALGHQVTLLYMSNGVRPPLSGAVRVAEATKACSILGAHPAWAGQIDDHTILDNEHYAAFRKIIESENPDAVFTHWLIDNHPDHRAIANLTYESWTQLKHQFPLYYYEVSDGDDTLQFGVPTEYVDITAVADIKKTACYAHASESPDYFYPLQDAVAVFRGIESGYKRAEAYIRQVESPYDFFSMAGIAVR